MKGKGKGKVAKKKGSFVMDTERGRIEGKRQSYRTAKAAARKKVMK